MAPAYEIRVASVADVERIVPLALAAGRDADVHHDPARWSESLTRDVEDADRLLVAAVDGAEVVGYARAHLVEPAADAPDDHSPRGHYLIGLWVPADRRRAGIADALTETRLRWIAERDDEAWFFTRAHNAASIALHRRFGFEEHARRFTYSRLVSRPGENEHVLFHARAPFRGR